MKGAVLLAFSFYLLKDDLVRASALIEVETKETALRSLNSLRATDDRARDQFNLVNHQ